MRADQVINGEKFASEFVCQICRTHVVGNDPKLTKCSHMFCGDCLADWFIKHPDSNSSDGNAFLPCPTCDTALDKDTDVFPIEKKSPLLWRMLRGLKVKCDSKQGPCVGKGCKWTGEYADYWQHLKAVADANAKAEEHEVKEIVASAEVIKEQPPSPSTCSPCSPAPSEGSTLDDNGKVCPSSEEDWHQAHMDDSTGVSDLEEPLGQDLSALIRGWMDLELDSCDLASAAPCEEADVTTTALPPLTLLEERTITSTTPNLNEAGSATKAKAKKEKSLQAHAAQTHAQAQANYQWQLYAHYQMEYMRHYQAAYARHQVNQLNQIAHANQMAHAARMHQAMQLHQQHLLAQGTHTR